MKARFVIIIVLVLAMLSGIIIWRNLHKAAPPPKLARKRAVKAAIPKVAEKARVAIVMDDFGYNMNHFDTLFSIRQPITLSILPDLPYSEKIAKLAREHGYEAILHLPLEAHNKEVKEEVDTIKSGMPEPQIKKRLSKEIASVPGLTGVSNHMGSKATEDKKLMTAIFRYLKNRNLYFFDSLTSEHSICREAAGSAGIKYARRDIFLDNTDKTDYIAKQLRSLERFALKKGRAIAICHDRNNTIKVLAKMMPAMAERGIKFVYLREMVK
jgi:uncharacterized protein